MTNEGVLKLLPAIKANHHFIELNLAKVPVCEAVKNQLDEIVLPSPFRKTIEYSFNKRQLALTRATAQWTQLDGLRQQLLAAEKDEGKLIVNIH